MVPADDLEPEEVFRGAKASFREEMNNWGRGAGGADFCSLTFNLPQKDRLGLGKEQGCPAVGKSKKKDVFL